MHGSYVRSSGIRRLVLFTALVAGLVLLLAYSSSRYAPVTVDYETPPAWWPSSHAVERVPTVHLKLSTHPYRRDRRQDDAVLWSSRPFIDSGKHAIDAMPREALLPSNAPGASNLLFAFTTTAKRATDLFPLWQHYLRFGSPCIVVLPPDEADERDALQRTLGGQCKVRVSTRERYEDRVGSVVIEVMEESNGLQDVRWVIVGDDDTYWLDMRTLRRMLSKYSDEQGMPSGDHFIGGLTEAVAQWGAFGRQAYGGGGILMSMPLVKQMASRFEECLAFVEGVWTGGDGVLTYCAALIKNEDHHAVLQEELGLHQMDVPGDGTGFFQAGLPFVSVHHYIDGWTDFFPKQCGLPSTMHEDRAAIAIMTDSVNLLGGDNLFSRYVFDDGRALLTLGYTVSIFRDALSAGDLGKMEYTWSYDGYNMTFPQRGNIAEGNGKTTYYLERTDATKQTQHFLTCDGQRLELSYEWAA